MNRIEELTALLEQITPGKWYRGYTSIEASEETFFSVASPHTSHPVCVCPDTDGDEVRANANARFIAIAPQAVRDLLEVAKAAQALQIVNTVIESRLSDELEDIERDVNAQEDAEEALRKALEAFK